MPYDACILLNSQQSVRIHGWAQPRRILTWKMICENEMITPQLCVSCGITQQQLMQLQPDVQQWIECKKVCFADVPYMTEWPLHPIRHLSGCILHFIEHKYSASLLKTLDISFDSLLTMHMTCDMMKLFAYTHEDWHLLGLRMEALKQ